MNIRRKIRRLFVWKIQEDIDVLMLFKKNFQKSILLSKIHMKQIVQDIF
jgi:hypothetical protein